MGQFLKSFLALIIFFFFHVTAFADMAELFRKRLPPAVQNVVREHQVSVKTVNWSEAKTVVIFGDPQVYSRFLVGKEVWRLEKEFGSEVIPFMVDSMAEFVAALKMLTESKTLIKAFVTHGVHGNHYDGIPNLELPELATGDFDVSSFGELQQAGVNLNFTPAAFLHFDACKMVDDSTEEFMLSSFAEVKKIGFKTGWIYLNKTDGVHMVDNMMRVPFYENDGASTKERAKRAMWQIIGWSVGYPIFAYQDLKTLNQGYMMGVSERYEVILKTSSKQVENGHIIGDVIYAR